MNTNKWVVRCYSFVVGGLSVAATDSLWWGLLLGIGIITAVGLVGGFLAAAEDDDWKMS